MYEPQEDSYLLKESIDEFSSKNKINIALDMGAGTGIQGLALLNKAETIILTDINRETLEFLQEELKRLEDEKEKITSPIRLYAGNLFEKIPEEFHKKIDLIIFNPPYLPREEYELDDPELTSGESGIETTKQFLTNAKQFLIDNGTIFFVASSLSKIKELESHMKKEKYEFRVDRKKHISFEDIIIYRAWIK